jgi:hypothetical protein
MKMAVFWDVAPCNLVDIARSFIGVYLITLMIEAVKLFRKSQSVSTRIHGATSQKKVIFLMIYIYELGPQSRSRREATIESKNVVPWTAVIVFSAPLLNITRLYWCVEGPV